MKKIAQFIVNHSLIIMIIFVLLVGGTAFLIPKVTVVYDIASYLPRGTDTQKAIDVMDKEFEDTGGCTLNVKDIEQKDATALSNKIKKIKGVALVSFTPDTDYKNKTAKIAVTFDAAPKDPEALKAYDDTLKLVSAGGYSYSIPKPLNDDFASTLSHEMLIIVLIAAAVIVLVLLFTSKSFAEVLAFPIVFVAAAVLNMGTNCIFGKISFVSNTVCIILQLALAIDYAIILCHRFTEEKDKTPLDPKGSMVRALTKAIPEIASSSLTTISGLVALMFMQLRLGLDLGAVLAKSIVCSMLCVFLIMPGTLLLLSKTMDKTRHRNFVPKFKFWGRGVIKARYVLLAIFAGLFSLGVVFSQKIDYCYSLDDIDTSRPTQTVVAKTETQATFGYDNVFAILLDDGDVEGERKVVEKVKELGGYDGEKPLVNSALGYSTIEFNGLHLTDDVTVAQVASAFNLSSVQAEQLFRFYCNYKGKKYRDGMTIKAVDLINYVILVKDGLPISDDLKAKLNDVPNLLNYAKSQLVGENHVRLVFNLNASLEDPAVTEFIKKVTPEVKAIRGDAIFAGSAMTAYDLNMTFSSDNMIITMLTVAFIWLILSITFRSPVIPIALVLIIQGAIFMNFSLPFITGKNLFFFVYLIVSAIQMGATIDYAILLTNRFKALAKKTDKKTAMIEAVSACFPTVFTSGTIMSVAGFLVGFLTSHPLISSMGMFVGSGTVISILCVLLFLPAMLYVFWTPLKKTIITPKKKMKNFHTPNPSVAIYKTDD